MNNTGKTSPPPERAGFNRPFVDLLYYSFVTLTTLGYGDITPLTEKAKSLTILEAFIGQVYFVVVLAWLVGMHVSRKSK